MHCGIATPLSVVSLDFWPHSYQNIGHNFSVSYNVDVECSVDLLPTKRYTFAITLRSGGLNFDANPQKKKGLLDFLCCLPAMLEQAMKNEHRTKPFAESGMTDDKTGLFPAFYSLIGTCKRWVSSSKDAGIPRCTTEHCREQFQHLAKIQQEIGQVSYTDMLLVGIPKG